jgi:hypothetical protein
MLSLSPSMKVEIAFCKTKASMNWPAGNFQGLNHKMGMYNIIVKHQT